MGQRTPVQRGKRHELRRSVSFDIKAMPDGTEVKNADKHDNAKHGGK